MTDLCNLNVEFEALREKVRALEAELISARASHDIQVENYKHQLRFLEPENLQLYAWIGEDETGEIGIKSIVSTYGILPLVKMRRIDFLQRQVVKSQIQEVADTLQKPMHLMRFVFVQELDTLLPGVKFKNE